MFMGRKFKDGCKRWANQAAELMLPTRSSTQRERSRWSPVPLRRTPQHSLEEKDRQSLIRTERKPWSELKVASGERLARSIQPGFSGPTLASAACCVLRCWGGRRTCFFTGYASTTVRTPPDSGLSWVRSPTRELLSSPAEQGCDWGRPAGEMLHPHLTVCDVSIYCQDPVLQGQCQCTELYVVWFS